MCGVVCAERDALQFGDRNNSFDEGRWFSLNCGFGCEGVRRKECVC